MPHPRVYQGNFDFLEIPFKVKEAVPSDPHTPIKELLAEDLPAEDADEGILPIDKPAALHPHGEEIPPLRQPPLEPAPPGSLPGNRHGLRPFIPLLLKEEPAPLPLPVVRYPIAITVIFEAGIGNEVGLR